MANEVKDEGAAIDKLNDLMGENERRLLNLDYTLTKRIRRMVELCFWFTIASIVLQVIENEILQNQKCIAKAKFENLCVIENEDMTDRILAIMDALKFGNACVSLIAVAICIRYHMDSHSLQLVHRNMVVAPRDVVNKNVFWAVIDIFVTGLFVPPFNTVPLLRMTNMNGNSYVRIEYWMTMLSFLKLNWAFRYLLKSYLNKFDDSLVLRKLAHFDPGLHFAIKVCVWKNPVSFLAFCWLVLFTWTTYALRLVEAPAHENSLPLSQTLWLCLVAFTTVGYGDIVPKSHIVVTWQNYISLKYSEKNVVKVYQHSLMKSELRNGAAKLIKRWLNLMIQKSKVPGKKWTVTLYWSMLEEVGLWRKKRQNLVLEMRALNSGRRWGSDVPTFRDILRAVEILHDNFQKRSVVLSSICNRVADVSTNFNQVEDKTHESIARKTELLLTAFENSHPLVPRRKQSAYELERGPIYPESEAEKWTCLLQDSKSSPLPNQSRKKIHNTSSQLTTGNAADTSIRTDPSLEVFFIPGSSEVAKDGRDQPFRKKTLDLLNPT